MYNEKDAIQSVYNEIFNKKIYEKRGIKIEPTDTWIDLGGNVGFFSDYVLLKGSKIQSIYEPFKKYYDVLIKKNNYKDILIYNKAVWFKDCIKEFYVCDDGNYQRNTLINHYKKKKMIQQPVECVDFNKILFNGCCIKMDIEGSELYIIDNATDKWKAIKKIIIEYHLDKDTKLENYYNRIEILKKYFKILKYDNLKQKDGSKIGDLKIFPSGRLIYGWN